MLDEVRSEDRSETDIGSCAPEEKSIGQFRQILLWPVHLAPVNSDSGSQDHAAVLSKLGPNNPWREIEDEFTGDPLTSKSATIANS